MLTNDVLSFYAQIDDVPDDGHSTSAGLDHFNCYLHAARYENFKYPHGLKFSIGDGNYLNISVNRLHINGVNPTVHNF
jgi:hypothetical protein